MAIQFQNMSQTSDETKGAPPRCIGIIMDGNRRWARSRGLPTLEGHRVGYNKMKNFLTWAKEADIQFVIVYAFSSENWNRSPEEVSYLMNLFKHACAVELAHFKKENARLCVIGDRARLSADVRSVLEQAEQETIDCTGVTLVLAISYGGRDEIVQAARAVCGKKPEEITQESFAEHLWTKDIPDPDLIIRTSGEHRLSNFLLWQAAYSELFFTEPHWPDFSKQDFLKILEEYKNRERRFGK